LAAFAMAAIASRSVPECFMPMRLANNAGTSEALSCSTLHSTMYFRQDTADEVDTVMAEPLLPEAAAALDWS